MISLIENNGRVEVVVTVEVVVVDDWCATCAGPSWTAATPCHYARNRSSILVVIAVATIRSFRL